MNRHYLPLRDLSSASAHGHQHARKSSKPLPRAPLTDATYMVCTQAADALKPLPGVALQPLPNFTTQLQELEEKVAALQETVAQRLAQLEKTKIEKIDDLRFRVIQFDNILQHYYQSIGTRKKVFQELPWAVLHDADTDAQQEYSRRLRHAKDNGYEILPAK